MSPQKHVVEDNASSDDKTPSKRKAKARKTPSKKSRKSEVSDMPEPTEQEASDTLYINKLSTDTTEDVLQGAFPTAISIRVAKNITGKSKGYGFIEFKTPTSAAKAMKKMSNKKINGTTVNMEFAKKKESHSQLIKASKTLLITGLPSETTKEELHEEFEHATTVRVLADAGSTAKRNALVEFPSEDKATAAMEENDLDDENIVISYFNRTRSAKTLYVGNLSAETTKEMLHEAFPNALSTRMPMDKENDTNKGYAFVTFKTNEQAALALENITDLEIDSQKVIVHFEIPHTTKHTQTGNRSGGGDPKPSSRIMIRNLADTTKLETLKKLFRKAELVKLATNKSGKSRGFAFASFKTIDEATDAIEKTKKRKIDGRMLRARYADLKGYSGSGKSTKSDDSKSKETTK